MVFTMPISIRIISIIDQKYTVEMEIEEDDWLTIWQQLNGTPWGRRVLHLVTTMLPNYPEVKKEDEPDVETDTEKETKKKTTRKKPRA